MRQGFTLIELSVVLVIIGLLAGGILSGRTLVHAAEMRSITSDMERYTTAIAGFRDKYFTIPGDMPSATAFWGAAGGAGNDAACQAATGTGTQTCSGDGDGSLLNGLGVMEGFRFWQHLANAKLVEGAYSGVVAATPSGHAPRVNLPPSKIRNAYFLAQQGLGLTVSGGSTLHAGDASSFAGDYGMNMFLLRTADYAGGAAPAPDLLPLKPEDAWNMDRKTDDGMPGTGKVMANKGTAAVPCTTAAGVAPPGDAGATYLVSSAARDCVLFFTRAF